MKWQIVSPQSLHMKVWDNEAVVYDAQSGNTHLLGADAAQALSAIRQMPADAASLAHLLSAEEPGQSMDDAEGKMEAILAELAGISLISPVAP